MMCMFNLIGQNASLTRLTTDLEHKLFEMQEKQRLESAEQFKSHKEISETLQKRFEEKTTSYMQVDRTSQDTIPDTVSRPYSNS